MADDLVAFLRARFDEEEAEARAAVDDPPMSTIYRWDGPKEGEQVPAGVGWWGRRLAEVAAKRRIVDYLDYEMADHGADNPWWYDDKLIPILQHLAMPFRDHPDFRVAWAVDTSQ